MPTTILTNKYTHNEKDLHSIDTDQHSGAERFTDVPMEGPKANVATV
jgi:hypothetical protein